MASASLRPKSGYIPTLDGWRAIAVGLVLFNHAPILAGRLQPLVRVQGYGAYGVDLFFAISGLLICSRLLEEERTCGRISLRGFYIRRSLRIFPAAYTYLAAIAVAGLVHLIPMDWPAWTSAILFLRNYFTCLVRDTAVNRFTGHFWSLAIEEHFYLLLPSALLFFPRHRKLLLFSLTALAFLWLALYLRITPVDLRSISWERRTDLRIASLLFPAFLSLFLVESGWRKRFTQWLRPNYLLVALAICAIALLLKLRLFPHPVTAAIPVPTVEPDTFVAPRGGPAHLAANLLVPLLFPLLVLSTMLNPSTQLGRVLEWQPLKAMGRISYSIYLWQQLFWVAPYRKWPIHYLQRPAIAFVLVFAAAIASYFLVEKPLIRLGHRLAPPPTPGHRDLDGAARDAASRNH